MMSRFSTQRRIRSPPGELKGGRVSVQGDDLFVVKFIWFKFTFGFIFARMMLCFVLYIIFNTTKRAIVPMTADEKGPPLLVLMQVIKTPPPPQKKTILWFDYFKWLILKIGNFSVQGVPGLGKSALAQVKNNKFYWCYYFYIYIYQSLFYFFSNFKMNFFDCQSAVDYLAGRGISAIQTAQVTRKKNLQSSEQYSTKETKLKFCFFF